MEEYIPLQISDEFKSSYYNLFYQLSKEAFETAKEHAGHKRYMTKKEACEYIGISFTHLKKLEMPIIEIRGKFLIDREDITAFMNKHKK
ncbi:hypothetical protein CR203_21400 [Salipaludibacillus neizhouensis]|uniref:DNA-binding protein n=1 Tax=Salipaludibacillus neizhouensis TaxID=885475 RepID=A0A3A9K395_9BACI|nr:hypothetical protein [Salipaludibacillus neizhouensis]RKL65360.1 hypothetical protein CR203_21400 [Salipaludibacillus neizhouensis]